MKGKAVWQCVHSGRGGGVLRWLDLALNANLMLTNSFLATNGNGNGKGKGDTECAVQKEVGSAGGGGGGVHARNIHSVAWAA